MQLELDFASSPPVQVREVSPLAGTPPDIDLGRFARDRMAYGSVRERQGVLHRFALPGPALIDVTAELRLRVEDGDDAAIVETSALLSGVPPEHAGAIGLLENCSADPPVIAVSVRTGQLHTDLGRVCLAHAAQPATNGTTLPASHVLIKPLPRFLVQALSAAFSDSPQAFRLRHLFDVKPAPAAIPICGSREGRLRATHARARDGLSALAIELNLDNYDAALVTNDFALVDKARLFYVLSDPQRIANGCRCLYAALGWDEPVPFEVLLPFGSKVVPHEQCVAAVYACLRGRAAATLPGRRYALDSLVHHHNHYATLTAWLLAFCVGAREAIAFDFMARTCRPGSLFVPYRDKLVGPFKHIRPVLMSGIVRDQVTAWWRHLQALHDRVRRLRLPHDAEWVRHLGAVLAKDRVPLLFHVRGGTALPIGSAQVAQALPTELRLVPNAGRHYWQTALYRHGVSTHAIDVFARHACRGTEPLSSTTLLAPAEVHRQVCDVQDTVLRSLGIAAVSGLGRRLAA